MDAETNARLARYEMSRQADELHRDLGTYIEILEDCFTEVAEYKITDDRLDMLRCRFELIATTIKEKAIDFVDISREVETI